MPIQPGQSLSPAFRRRGLRSRLLFHWRARDLSLNALTGQVGTFTRASAGGAVPDRNGLLYTPVHSQPRWEQVATYAGIEAALRLEGGRTNLLTQSSNFGAWTASASPAGLTSGIKDPLGGTGAYLITDDNAAGAEYVELAVTFTGDAEKAFAVYVRPESSGTSVFRIRDLTAGVERMLVQANWVGGALGSVGVSTGTYLGYTLAYDTDGILWYRLLFRTAAVTAANSHVVRLYPAEITSVTGTATGGCYFFGAQAEDGLNPTSYTATAGATVARTKDSLSWAFPALVQPLSMYVRFVLHGLLPLGSDLRLLTIGASSGGASWLELHSILASASLQARIRGLATGSSGSVAPGALHGQVIEALAWLRPSAGTATIQLQAAVDGVAGAAGAASGAAAIASTFNGNILTLNGLSGSTVDAHASYLDAKVGAGILTLDQIREAL